MKKVLSLLTLFLAACLTLVAQDEEMMKQAQQRFKEMKTLSAPVTQTRHNAMLADDVVTKGMFYFKKPSNMCLTFEGGKDMLLIKGDEFTMVRDGKPSTMSAKGNTQMEALKTLLKNFSTGQESDVSLDEVADVDVEREGDLMTMTIQPRVADAKARRKMLYRSFVVVVDLKAGALKSVRLNEKGANYTLYTFGEFTLDAPVPDSHFLIP